MKSSVLLLAMTTGLIGGLMTTAALSADDVAAFEEQAMIAAVTRVAPAVVRIETVGGVERVGEVLLGDGPTTGLIVAKEGYIISSAFNFLRQPSSILVTLPNGKRTPAEIVARDHSRMLVLLKVSADGELPVPEAVAVDQVQVGQWAIAVGRALDAQQPNMSVGIISAKDRIWGRAIQCDAKISPSNYGGPLVDIQGRVFGVLVPMSPDEQSEVAGAEWYDSGIGFAIPLEDIQRNLATMQQGEDVHPGLLGITLKGGSIYTNPAEIAASQFKSPAFEAGLRAGDVIVEVDGLPIARQAQLKHALGTHYAGEMVSIIAKRGDERIAAKVKLTDKLLPFEHPALGILPRRDREGVVVRYVFPGSGATESGIPLGAKLLRINEQPVVDALSLRLQLANFEPRQKVSVVYEHAETEHEVSVNLGTLPEAIPQELPPAREREALEEPVAQAGFVDIKIPEEPNECLAFIPPSDRPDIDFGVVVYLRKPGDFDRDQLLARWRNLCVTQDLILLVPQPLDNERWTVTELEFIKKSLDHVLGNYRVDKSRVVSYGQEAGGALSYLFAFRQRELVRGVLAIDATIPSRVRIPDNDPVYPLAVLTTTSPQTRIAKAVEETIATLRTMKYPVTELKLDESRELSEEELSHATRWIDALDRL